MGSLGKPMGLLGKPIEFLGEPMGFLGIHLQWDPTKAGYTSNRILIEMDTPPIKSNMKFLL